MKKIKIAIKYISIFFIYHLRFVKSFKNETGKHLKLHNLKNILFLGNSITYHDYCPSIGWYGQYGMAASSIDNDYVHILQKWFGDDKNYMVKNIADFEREPLNFGLEKMDECKKNSGLI